MARHPDLRDDAGDELDDEHEHEPTTAGRAGGAGTAGFATGLLVGALVGAGLALLLAPDAGDVTRERLARRLRDLRRRGGDRLERAARRVRR
jgi:hypothetical protein